MRTSTRITRNSIRGATGVAVVAVAVLVLSACSSSGKPSSAGNGGTGSGTGGSSTGTDFGKLTINNSNFNTEWGLVAIADSGGCFKQAGFSKVELAQSGNSSADLISINAGRLDMSAGSFADVVGAAQKNLSNVVSIGTDYAAPASYLLASNDLMSGFTDSTSTEDRIKALKGKKIAVTTAGGFNYIYASQLLKSVGLNPETDATLVTTGSQANELAALKAGRVDAAVETQPQVAQAVTGKFGQVMFEPTSYPVTDFKQGTINASRKAISDNPAKFLAVGKALTCAAQIVLNDPDKAKTLARQYSGGAQVSDAVWNSMWAQAVEPNEGGVWIAAKTNYALSDEDIQKNIDFKGVTDVKPSQIYDPRPFGG